MFHCILFSSKDLGCKTCVACAELVELVVIPGEKPDGILDGIFGTFGAFVAFVEYVAYDELLELNL